MAAPPRDPLALVWEREEEDQEKVSTARSNATVRLCFLHKFGRRLQTRNRPLFVFATIQSRGSFARKGLAKRMYARQSLLLTTYVSTRVYWTLVGHRDRLIKEAPNFIGFICVQKPALPQLETGKINCVRPPRYGRLPPGARKRKAGGRPQFRRRFALAYCLPPTRSSRSKLICEKRSR
jgi:hypothetical protein